MDDPRAALHEELVYGVDVGPLAGAEADVMQADPRLDEALAPVALLRLHDPDRRAPADAVEHAVRLDDRPETEEAEQLLVEGQAGVEVAHGEHHVRDAV